MATRKKRRITAEDLYRLQPVVGPQISPAGRHVVFCLARVDRKTQKRSSNLWVVPTRGGRPRQFTYGDQADASPKWSPDGTRIAFVSNRGDEKQPQLHVVPFGGGEARPLTTLKGTFGGFEWAPDGRSLVCSFRKKDREQLEREADEQKKKLGVVARHIDRVFFRVDGQGYLPRERWHLWTVHARTGRARQLTHGAVRDETSPRLSPDGSQIVFLSNRAKDPDLDPEAVDVLVMPAAGGRPRKLNTPIGGKGLPTFSPDGSHVAYLGTEGRGNWWRNTGLWVVPVAGRKKARNLLADTDLSASAATINDITGIAGHTPPTWSPDGRSLYAQVSRYGSTELMRAALDGGLATVVSGPGVVGSFSLDAAGATLAYGLGDMRTPGELWVRDLAKGEARRLTNVAGPTLGRIDLGEVEEVWLAGPAGNQLQGWVLKPPGFRAGKKYPSVLEIHGGPLAQYGHFFMHEFYFLAAHGYVVSFANPRGGAGYGEEHAKAIWDDWGSADYDDVMAWADYLASQPYIDPERMGVTGGSYGGYLTNWIIGHTDRFRAAVTQRSVSNLVSMWGSSDFNWLFQRIFGDRPPWESLENYWRQSPIAAIGNATTPTLVIHSEQDLRCAREQGEQVYVALKTLGVPTELVLFPDEPHGLSRGGRTDRRIERLGHILRWFDRHLKRGKKA